jgi:hypothetical protein
MRSIIVTVGVCVLFLGAVTVRAETPAGETVPCPEGMECVLVDTFTKADVSPETKKYQVAALTQGGGFFRVVIMQKGADGVPVVVLNIRLRHRGRWVSYEKEDALPEGRTAFPIAVPRYTDELTLLLDKGKGSHLQVILEREAAGR